MKKLIPYLLRILLLPILFSCSQSRSKLPSLEETYRYDDKNPFGGWSVYNRFTDFFSDVKITKVPLYDFYKNDEEDSTAYSTYVVLTKRMVVGDEESRWLIDYVKEGNDLFISADYIDERFLEKIQCETNQKISHLQEQWGNMKDTKVSLYFGKKLPLISYQYYYFPFNNYIRKYQEDNARVLGVNEQSMPNFLILFFGKGRLYLHVAPRAFSNYFLLRNNNSRYLDNVISYLRLNPSIIYWDEYFKNIKPYKDESDENFSTLSVIMKNPTLKWAFWLAVFGIAFFVFSAFKRKQKSIPLLADTKNSTVDFVQTVGRLYYVNANNKNIATKLITYFKEIMRSKYFIRNFDNRQTLSSVLAGKSGAPVEEVEELLALVEAIENSESVSDETLMALNKKLENFYKSR